MDENYRHDRGFTMRIDWKGNGGFNLSMRANRVVSQFDGADASLGAHESFSTPKNL
jgi:hypothetical protein